MTETRVRCTAKGCRNQILPATAARTGGICRPCEYKIAAERHEEYVRANRREVDPFAGVTDPVEIVKLLVRPTVHDELRIEKPFAQPVDAFIQSLAPRDVERLIALAIELESDDIARWLAAFTSADLAELQSAWVEAGDFHPGIIFRGAPASIRDTLIEEVHTNPNHALMALAWIGDEVVVEQFARWRKAPPSWAAELFVRPHQYAHEAGWELDDLGHRRTLFRSPAFALIKGDGVTSAAKGRCKWCRSPLTTLLEDVPQRIVTCTNCTMYGPLFMREGQWHPGNVKPQYLSDDRPERWKNVPRLVRGPARNVLHAADQFLPTSFSQAGGLPAWIQDSAYPACPDCGRTMPFIAQVSFDELRDDYEGLMYAFSCDGCGVTATTHQQT